MIRHLPRYLVFLAAAGWLAGHAPRQGLASSAIDAARSVPAAKSFRFDGAGVLDSAPVAERGAPLSLTASDGTGLLLEGLVAHGVLEGPLAFTELRMSFRNPHDRVLEGRFSITLPPQAVLSRFAMKIGNSWQEGEVVERRRARRIYEDFLHRRQDPALLEQQAGNVFSARVFPIPANSLKELVVSYSHALASADEPYRVPLLGLPEIASLDVRVLLGDRPAAGSAVSSLGGSVSERRLIELHKKHWRPTQDFEVSRGAPAAHGLRDGNLVVVRVAPEVDVEPHEIDGLCVLLDSSASRALGYQAQVELAANLLRGLRDGAGGDTPVAVAAFDQGVKPIYDGPVSGFDERHVRRLLDHGALGASDLEGALRWLAFDLGEGDRRCPRLLLLTDGVATAGHTEGAPLGDAVGVLGEQGVERLDVVAVGGLRDAAALQRLVVGHLDHDGQVVDGSAPVEEIARRLTRATRSGIEVAVEGAKWVWPQVLNGVQPGDEALIYADLPAEKPVRLALAGRRFDLGDGPLKATRRPLLERAWVKSRMDRLLYLRETQFAADPDVRSALASEVRELSLKHRVLSPFTAFLVLETERDYRRYELDREALADILTVGPAGLEVVNRTPLPGPRPAPLPMKQRPTPMDEPEERLFVGGDRAEGFADEVVFGIPQAPPEVEPEGPIRGGGESVTEEAMVIMEAEPEASLRVGRESVPRSHTAPGRRLPRPHPRPDEESARPEESGRKRQEAALTGRFAQVRERLEAGRPRQAREIAERWNAESPGDVLALVALGEACEATDAAGRAARAYGSLIDLFPSRADLRRYAGERLESLAAGAGLALAVDTYGKAVAERPDHPSSHRQLAWALARSERWEEAFQALEAALSRSYPAGRFASVERILREDLSLVAAAWSRAAPARHEEIGRRLREKGCRPETEPSMRFVLTWETDANDVDLHVYDGRGGHAYYEAKRLPSGGELYADVTTGYGPECFTIRGSSKKRAHPYRLQAHYYSRGPMGYGMGTVQVIAHDGHGGLDVESRPFVVMSDGAYVDLGVVRP